jgi:hypothetical protein
MKSHKKTISAITVFAVTLGLGFFLWAGHLPWKNTPSSINNIEEYLKWLNNPKNGLVLTKIVNGFQLTVKYLPPDYLAYRELSEAKDFTVATKDSILSMYAHNMSFLLKIAPDEKRHRGDIMFWNTESYREYKERVHTMNFAMSEYIALKTDLGTYKPVLSTLENVHGLTPGRNILLVFADEQNPEDLRKARFYDFIYTDEIFDTGINHFVFSKEALQKIPQLIF